MVLVSSNPTNLVISGAFSIPFMTYTAHVILPFLVSALLVFPTLAIIFFRSELLVPKVLAFVPTGREAGNENGMAETQRAEDRNAILIDKQGAVFGSVVLVAALGVLVGTSTIGVPVWEVTVPAAGIVLMRDVYHDWKLGANGGQVNGDAFPLRTIQGCSEKGHVIATPAHADFPDTERHAVDLGNNVDAESSSPFDLLSFIQHCLNTLSSRFPTFTTILKRLPISLLPFAILMFILVQGLSAQGWVEVFARWWSAWVKKTGVLGAIGGMGFISCILCNVSSRNPVSSAISCYPDAKRTKIPHIDLWNQHRSNNSPCPRAPTMAFSVLLSYSNHRSQNSGWHNIRPRPWI